MEEGKEDKKREGDLNKWERICGRGECYRDEKDGNRIKKDYEKRNEEGDGDGEGYCWLGNNERRGIVIYGVGR